MSSTPSAIYLVAGASRGIGLALVARIAERHPDAFIYAGVRDPTTSSLLNEVAAKHPGRIAILKYVAADEKGNAALAQEIQEKHGRVDTVIANAGISKFGRTVLRLSADEMTEHFTINAVGPVILFQAVHDLLKASSTPRFVPISSASGSLGSPGMALPLPAAAYGASKSALNHFVRKIHFENDWLVSFPINPGAVETDMFANNVATMDPVLVEGLRANIQVLTTAQSANLILEVIDNSTREKDGGEFRDVEGPNQPW